MIGPAVSASSPVPHGVLPGSILGPLLFTVYLEDISIIMERLGVPYVIYADDIQLWLHCSVGEVNATLMKISESVSALQKWLSSNMLVLNKSKTELILCGNPKLLSRVTATECLIGDTAFSFSSKVKDLGVAIDSSLTFSHHIAHISSAAFSYLRVIGRLRRSLSKRD